MDLTDKIALVTGGTRGLGRGVVEALAERAAQVIVVARRPVAIDLANVQMVTGDIIEKASADILLETYKPDVLILNAGAEPPMAPLDTITWEEFSTTWDVDTKGGLFWIQAALNTPLRAGSRVLVVSSGAAIQGSPMSGGYAGAKRMLWTMAQYANDIASRKNLGIAFQVVVPRQMVAGTGVGTAGSTAYARAQGITPEAFLERFGAPMPPRLFGDHVASILCDPQYERPLAFGVKGDTGIVVLEDAAS